MSLSRLLLFPSYCVILQSLNPNQIIKKTSGAKMSDFYNVYHFLGSTGL